MYTKSIYLNEEDEKQVVEKFINEFSEKNIKLIVYFSSTKYDFKFISKEIKNNFSPNCKLIGCTTAGELIRGKGITKSSIVAIGFYGDIAAEVCKISNISKYPILDRKKIIETFEKTGLKLEEDYTEKVFAILLNDGLKNSEERVLSVFSSIFKDNLKLIGGSAGDDFKYKETLIGINGEVYTDISVVAFIKTDKKVKLYREGIFKATGVSMKVTSANIFTREIHELDNKPATQRYAELLGINEKKLKSFTVEHPIGRRVLNNVYVSTIQNIDEKNKILKLHAKIPEGANIELLEKENPLEIQDRVHEKIKKEFSRIDAVICINCCMRTLKFRKKDYKKKIFKKLDELGEYVGFVSYGEQISRLHLNQSMIMLVIGD